MKQHGYCRLVQLRGKELSEVFVVFVLVVVELGRQHHRADHQVPGRAHYVVLFLLRGHRHRHERSNFLSLGPVQALLGRDGHVRSVWLRVTGALAEFGEVGAEIVFIAYHVDFVTVRFLAFGAVVFNRLLFLLLNRGKVLSEVYTDLDKSGSVHLARGGKTSDSVAELGIRVFGKVVHELGRGVDEAQHLQLVELLFDAQVQALEVDERDDEEVVLGVELELEGADALEHFEFFAHALLLGVLLLNVRDVEQPAVPHHALNV